VEIRLTHDDVEKVLAEGSRRVMNALRGGLGAGKFFFAGDYGGLMGHAIGAAAECVSSKLTGEIWDPLARDFSTSWDVGGYEVRLTMHHHGEFRTAQDHEETSKKYLIVGLARRPWTFRAVGTIDGVDARAFGKLEDRMGYGFTWWVHEDKIEPISKEMADRVREPDAVDFINRAIEDLKMRKVRET